MKNLWLALVALSAISFAQKGQFTYRDSSGNLQISARGGKMTRVADGFRLNLSGPVSLTSKAQSMAVKADAVEVNLAGGSTMRVTSATATGNFSLVKTAADRTSRITGSKATLASGATSDQFTLGGAVTITSIDAAKRQTLNASGASGTASFASAGTAKGTLQRAVLDGSVKVTLLEYTKDGKASTIVVTGNRLTVEGQDSPTVTVSGNVKITGEGASTFGSFTNLAKAVFMLNAKGEVINSEMEAGSS